MDLLSMIGIVNLLMKVRKYSSHHNVGLKYLKVPRGQTANTR